MFESLISDGRRPVVLVDMESSLARTSHQRSQPVLHFPVIHPILSYAWKDFVPAPRNVAPVSHTLANARGKLIYHNTQSQKLLQFIPEKVFPYVEAQHPQIVYKPLKPKFAYIRTKLAMRQSGRNRARDAQSTFDGSEERGLSLGNQSGSIDLRSTLRLNGTQGPASNDVKKRVMKNNKTVKGTGSQGSYVVRSTRITPTPWS